MKIFVMFLMTISFEHISFNRKSHRGAISFLSARKIENHWIVLLPCLTIVSAKIRYPKENGYDP